MAKLSLKAGTTSKRLAVFVTSATSTIGAGLTGITAANLTVAAYWRESDGNVGATSISMVAGTRGTYASGGWVEKDATKMPGWYEFGVPDAALAAGAAWVEIELAGAANMVPVTIEIELTATDNQTAVASVNVTQIAGQAATAAAPVAFPAAVGTSTYAGGTVASVTGDVGGKVLGGGASALSGVGVREESASAVKAKTDLIPAAGPADAASYTAARAAKLDDLDATISSRLATVGYTAPDNASIAAAATSAATAATKATLAADILEGDESIDKATTPTQWQQVIKLKGTATEKVRKKLYKSDGTTAVKADTDIVGQRSES